MANSIVFVEGPSGLGQPLQGQDFISGYAHYTTYSLPVGFTVSNVQEIFSVTDLENLGVTASNNDYGVIHYNVSEFFRLQPKGALYLQINTSNVGGLYNELTTLQSYAHGTIRQTLVYDQNALSTGNVTLLQTVANTNYTNNKPFEVIYQPQMIGLTLSTLPDLSLLTAKNVSVCIGQDGAGVGAALATSIGKTVGMGGTTLGAVSLSAVEESIAWPAKFNIDSGSEFDTLAFGNGQLYTSQSDGLLAQLDARRYIFAEKLIGINGSYFDNPYTAVSSASDYNLIPRNRTIHKAERNIRTIMLPQLASNIYFNADGSIRTDIIKYWESLVGQALVGMVNAGELSAYSVVINPLQNVLATNTLIINVNLQPVGLANMIVINIGFVTSV